MSISGIQSNPYVTYPAGTDTQDPSATTNTQTGGVGSGVSQSGQVDVSKMSVGGGTGTETADLTGGNTLNADRSSSHSAVVMELVAKFVEQLWTAPMAEIDELARVVVEEAASESRQTLDQSRNQADSAKAQLLNQAATLRTEASQMMSGAAAALVMTVVSSAVSLMSAAKQFSMLSSVKAPETEGLSEMEQKEAQSAYQTEMQSMNSKVGALNMGTSGVTQLLQGVGNFVNTFYQAQAKETEAKSAEDSAQAQQLQSYSDQSQKIADDLNKLADQIISLLKEINDAKAQMMQTMTRV